MPLKVGHYRPSSETPFEWVHVQIPEATQLYIGSLYRPHDQNDPAYLDQLNTCLSRIPVGAHTWLGGDFNLEDIDWETETVKPNPYKSRLCHQLLQISKDHYLDQLVLEPTRITEDTGNTPKSAAQGGGGTQFFPHT